MKKLISDIQLVLSSFPYFEKFANKVFLVTGATGSIGSLVVKVLLIASEKNNLSITVIAHGRNLDKLNGVFADYLNTKKLVFLVSDIKNQIQYDHKVDYIIHGANSTSSQSFIEQPVQTIMSIIEGTKNVLDFAKKSEVIKLVYLSSLEVYGTPEQFEVTETDSGYIDWTKPRSSYSEGKRMAECLCFSYFSQYDIPVVVSRLAQTFGQSIQDADNRVYAQFVRAVKNKKDIVLHTSGETIRNYCYLSDAVSALLYLLVFGEPGEAYNVANEETAVSIFEMAKIAESLSNGKTKVVFNIDNSIERGYNQDVKIKLMSKKLMALGWKPEIDLNESYYRMING